MSGKWKSYGIGIALMAFLVAAIVGWGASGVEAQSQAQSKLPLGSPVATTAKTGLLEQPATGSAVTSSLAVNARGIVLGGPFNDGWYWLNFSGKKGYILGKSLVLVDDKYTPVTEGTAVPTATATPQPTSTAPTATPAPATSMPSSDPLLGNYAGLWLGELSSAANVRTAAGTDKPRLKGWPAGRRVLLYQTVQDSKGDDWYRVSEPPEEPMYVHASLIKKLEPVVFEGAKFKGRWINVNVSQQITTAYENGKPVKVTLCSTGKGDNATTLGVWKIYWRLPKQDMDGGNLASGDYYSLKDVPYPQYFHTSGEGLHGTYWHDDFGRVHSHGCVNLSTPMSEWLYGWASIGTVVYVHK
jgi:hypothetical protein